MLIGGDEPIRVNNSCCIPLYTSMQLLNGLHKHKSLTIPFSLSTPITECLNKSAASKLKFRSPNRFSITPKEKGEKQIMAQLKTRHNDAFL